MRSCREGSIFTLVIRIRNRKLSSLDIGGPQGSEATMSDPGRNIEMPGRVLNRRLILIGQNPLSVSFVETAQLYLETLVKNNSPVLISSTDPCAMSLAQSLAQVVGSEPVLDQDWDNEGEDNKLLSDQRLHSKLHLFTSTFEVVCVHPAIIRDVLLLLQGSVGPSIPVVAQLTVQITIPTSDSKATVETVVYSEEALRRKCEQPNLLSVLFTTLNSQFRQRLINVFLPITQIFEPVQAGGVSIFSQFKEAVESSYYLFQEKLEKYRGAVGLTGEMQQLFRKVQEVAEIRRFHEQKIYNLLGTLMDLDRKIVSKTAEIAQIRKEMSQKPLISKSLPVKISGLELLPSNVLVVKVQHLKFLPKSYQLAYFPPVTPLNMCPLNCTAADQLIEIAPLSSFPPGDYEIFFHKPGDPAAVKSNKVTFTVEQQEGKTPMG